MQDDDKKKYDDAETVEELRYLENTLNPIVFPKS